MGKNQDPGYTSRILNNVIVSILLVLLLGRKRPVPADEVTAAKSGAGGPHLRPGQGHPQDIPQAACLRQVRNPNALPLFLVLVSVSYQSFFLLIQVHALLSFFFVKWRKNLVGKI
jgi:hypothetical protein